MAHNLNFDKRTGKYSFAAYGEVAWHGLGQYVDEAMTAEQAMQLAGLDFDVMHRPMYINNPDGSMTEVPGKVANVRADTNDIVGVVSTRYNILQNRDCFSFFDPIVDRSEAIYHTAGILGRGERIFLTAKLPDDFVVNDEKIENYIMLTNGHNGYHSLVAGVTPIRVVCNNTLTAALSGVTNKVSIRHSSNIKQRLEEAHRVMGISSAYMKSINGIFDAMAETPINDAWMKNLIMQAMYPKQEAMTEKERDELSTRIKNTTDLVFDFYSTHETQKSCIGTLWGGYNAISGYMGHVKGYSDAESRMNDIMFGNGSRVVQRAFDICLEEMKH